MKRHSRGFTLIELMITITLLAILLGFGIPTFRDFTRRNSVTSVQNDLVTAFNLARSESLRRNRNVSICASTDLETCAGDEEEWNQGWIAFTDRSVAGEVDGDDEVLQGWQSANTDLEFEANGSSFVRYLPNGMAEAAAEIDISWPKCAGPHLRRINVQPTGAIESHIEECPT
jgi:type IV fimbrial biogenesis protein FimT